MQEKEKPVVPIMIRLPRPLHGVLRRLSTRGYRSMNSQVVMLLEAAIQAEYPEEASHLPVKESA